MDAEDRDLPSRFSPGINTASYAPPMQPVPVPMVDLEMRHLEVADEVERRVRDVLRSGRYVGGPVVAEVEAFAARLCERTSAVATSSGTDALALALTALGVGPGDEVIVPALTFFATAGAVALAGAQPVVVDVREDGLLDPDAASKALTNKTRATIPVHLFGSPAPDPNLDVPVLDDAAQAAGLGRRGSFGTLTALSTYPTKTWGGAGHGGFVVGDDPELLDRVRSLGRHGADDADRHHSVAGRIGRNASMNAVQAAVLLVHGQQLTRRIERRRTLARRYDSGLPTGLRPLPRGPGCTLQQYCVMAEDRAAVTAALDKARIGWRVYYPRPLSQQPALQQAVLHPTPTAAWLCDRLLALPCHGGMSDQDADRVLEALHSWS
jgi:dTDP-4-amino-4,6-dideoxygalactose transaminase